MQYHFTNDPIVDAAHHIANVIDAHTRQGKRVLWLASGGSGVAVAESVTNLLTGHDTSRLTVSLTDERYGPIDHANENWRILLDHHAIPAGADTFRPLDGASIDHATQQFDAWLKHQFEVTDYTIGLFGIGADGHTAGIKPHSHPLDERTSFAYSFTGEDFERITMTFGAIERLDEIVIQAAGADKKAALAAALSPDQSLAEVPAHIFTRHPHAIVYTSIQQEDLL